MAAVALDELGDGLALQREAQHGADVLHVEAVAGGASAV
jgi:hypothetical protein